MSVAGFFNFGLLGAEASGGGTPRLPNTLVANETPDVALINASYLPFTPINYVTWDGATTASVTLSGDSLVATNTATSSFDQGAHVASTSGKNSGKYYFEVLMTISGGGGNVGTGIGTIASTFSTMGDTSTVGNEIFSSGNIWANGANAGINIGTSTSAGTHQFCAAVDLDNRKIWFRKTFSGSWNANAGYDPATNTGGVTVPSGTMIPFCNFGGLAGSAGNSFAANFGASAFGGAVPSGFTAGWPVGTVEAAAFLARTSGLDTTHINAYTTLINGLVADGLWPKLDVLHIYATQDSTTATLNLVSSTYNGTSHGSPTFTVDRGFTGSAGSTVFIGTGFIPSSATSPNFVQNSGHVSMWNVSNTTLPDAAFGGNDGSCSTIIAPRLSPSGSGFFRINETTAGGSDNTPVADASGHFIVSRTGASVVPAYRNGASILAGTMASVAVGTKEFYTIAYNGNGTASGAALQTAMGSIGGGLTATDATNLYSRLLAWMNTVGAATPAADFLARTSGLDSTHINAYTALINGLVADGIWSKLDVLHIYATQDTTTAQLNLVSSSFPASLNGAPVFTTDRGYQGVQASTTVVIDTNFNPTTAPSPKYAQNSAHLSCWSVTSVGDSDAPAIGLKNGANETTLYPKFPGFGTFFRINGTNAGGDLSNAASQGFFLGSRTAAAVTTGYLNGASLGVVTETSVAPINGTFYTLAERVIAGPAYGSKHQLAMASIGSGLSSADVANFYTRLRTYMTAVGVP